MITMRKLLSFKAGNIAASMPPQTTIPDEIAVSVISVEPNGEGYDSCVVIPWKDAGHPMRILAKTGSLVPETNAGVRIKEGRVIGTPTLFTIPAAVLEPPAA